MSETHVFSPNFLNKATFGFSRGGFYFNSGVDGTASAVPGGWIHAGQPVGAVVIGGGTTLNGASQLTNGGTNAGSNLSAARNLFTATDQVSITHGIHLITVGAWFQRLQSNSSFGTGPVRTSFVFQPGGFPGRHGEHVHLRPVLYAALVAFTGGRSLLPRTPSNCGRAWNFAWVSAAEFTNGWNEADGRAANYCIWLEWSDCKPSR